MELKKHNEIIDELEKLLDSNLGNVNPLEYAKLKEEYDNLMSEKAELESLLAQSKNDSELLAGKIVETEAERDGLKETVDELSKGVEGFQTRIEDLLSQIANLEDEVVRRDAVVVKMAEKYQLVEKDEFADSIVQEAEEKEKN